MGNRDIRRSGFVPARLPIALAAGLLVFCHGAAAVGSVSGLNGAPGVFTQQATAVSADGTVVAGNDSNTDVFLWSRSGGAVSLGLGFSFATGISADGTVVVGQFAPTIDNVTVNHAFRWTAATGAVSLGALPMPQGAPFSAATGVSADGNVVVGVSRNFFTGTNEAIRWTAQTGMVGLGKIGGGGDESAAYAVSGDGKVIVGEASVVPNAPAFQAMRWTAEDGMVALTGTQGQPALRRATGASFDGRVIVGFTSANEAFAWSQASGVTLLDPTNTFPGDTARGVSADGKVVVGDMAFLGTGELTGFRWTADKGIQPVREWLADAGVNTAGWQLQTARATSADGSTVVGSGLNPQGAPEAYIAVVPPPPDPTDPPDPPDNPDPPTPGGGVIGVDDFNRSLASLNAMAQGASHVSRALFSMTSANESQNSGNTAGPLVGYVSGSSAALTGVQLGANRADWGVGASFGGLRAQDSAYLNARSDVDGYWLGAHAWHSVGALFKQPRLTPLHISAGIQYGWFAADIKRRYFNASAIETAVSHPHLTTLNAAVTLDWRTRLSSGLLLVPYARAQHNHYHADACRERHAAFAGKVGSQRDNAMEYSFGATLEKQVTETVAFTLGYGLHVLDNERGPPVTIDVAHVGSFGVRGMAYDNLWNQFELGGQWQVHKRVAVVLGASVTDGSNYPEDWSSRLGLVIRL